MRLVRAMTAGNKRSRVSGVAESAVGRRRWETNRLTSMTVTVAVTVAGVFFKNWITVGG